VVRFLQRGKVLGLLEGGGQEPTPAWAALLAPARAPERAVAVAAIATLIGRASANLYPTPPAVWGTRAYAGSAARCKRRTARSIRSSERSLPSAASDSKIPGETVPPLIATRIGW
jgi:hypothetical protein